MITHDLQNWCGTYKVCKIKTRHTCLPSVVSKTKNKMPNKGQSIDTFRRKFDLNGFYGIKKIQKNNPSCFG